MHNRLINESSPYLLQHAHNPVDWYPWSEEAFEKARKEDKPVLVSIGYAACHWCHVMEKESFEDPAVAQYMNQHFVNIKVDREERPDVDHIYMDAVQAITGSGGWPLNAFLLPDGKPFYGGTYFPPRRAFNRASWQEVLTAIANAYREKKQDLEQQANTLTEHIKNASNIATGNGDFNFSKEKILTAFGELMKTADTEWGGFGNAPKFPQTFTINFLLKFSHLSGNKQAEKQALLSLDKMIDGGIYDQFGGGFARYSTDREWLAPHFEKMLYDNALIISSLAEAFQLTSNEKYSNAISETTDFLERELMDGSGGFYSALDADSEGVEGKFYVWSYQEVLNALGPDAALFAGYYDITPHGNWEETNIPRVKLPKDQFAMRENISTSELNALLERGRQKLMAIRSKRIRPGLDDKILLGWNALMVSALAKAFAATGYNRYLKLATRTMDFLVEKFAAPNGGLLHTWKNGEGRIPAFVDDYSYVINAMTDLATVSFDYHWLDKAAMLTGFVMEHFTGTDGIMFYYTPDFQKDILVRKIELYDGATPSGNSIMARNLYVLGILLDKPEWRERSEKMVIAVGEIASKHPISFGCWLALLMEMTGGTKEVVIIGPEAAQEGWKFLKSYQPHSILMVSPVETDRFPLFHSKKSSGKTRYFLCENYACQSPVSSLPALNSLINANNFYQMQ